MTASIVYGAGTNANLTLNQVVAQIGSNLVNAFPDGQTVHAGFYRRDAEPHFPTNNDRFAGNDFTTAGSTAALDGYVGVLSSDDIFGVDVHGGSTGPGGMYGSIEHLAFGNAEAASGKNTDKFLVFNEAGSVAFKDVLGINETGTGSTTYTEDGQTVTVNAVSTFDFTYSIMLAQTDKLAQVLEYNFGSLNQTLSELGATAGTGTYLNADIIGTSSALDDVLLAA